MLRSLCAAALTTAALGAALAGLSGPAHAADRDCSDFDTQRQAQRFFERHQPGYPHNLDGDGDGKACEDLPCPCGPGGGGGGGGGTGDNTQRARVKRVIDGDTVEARFDGKTPTVRLIGDRHT